MKGFKKDFVWGSATASYQVEGAANEDGRGLSIWDIFSKSGHVFEDNNGDVACDQYHRYKEDVQLMKELKHQAYRFSISWSRVIPDGTGKVNEKGIKYYQNLVDELLANGIEPYVTLYHWDLPYELHKRGGWLNREIVDWFAYFTEVVVKALPKVKHFITFNEPQCTIACGYGIGMHAPGFKLANDELMIASHNLLLAHGQSVKTIRKYSDAKIGYAPTCAAHYPATDSKEDLEAARQAFYSLDADPSNLFFCQSIFTDPVYLGKYPEGTLERYGKYIDIKPGDMELISQPIDFHCQNVYNGKPVKADGKGGYVFVEKEVGWNKTAIGWPITPKALYYAPKFIYERYKKTIFISENGLSSNDNISLDGKVHDPNRIDFVHRYLKEFKKASEDGIDVGGYFLWSLMDNFEWLHGYNQRFGLIYIDYPTGTRTVKDSAYWYREVIETNGENL